MNGPDPKAEGKEDLRKAFEERWQRLKRRIDGFEGLKMPDKEDLWRKVRISWASGFRCEYCKGKMKIRGSGPALRSFTFEHKDPLSMGGDNSLGNIAIACTKCNIAKGTLDADTFEDLLTGKKAVSAGVSGSMKEFFKLADDGWSSECESVDKLLRHLRRRSKSTSTRRTYLQKIRGFCEAVEMDPDELVELPKDRAEELVQGYADSYNTSEYSVKTTNLVLTALRTFFRANGFKNSRSLEVESYHMPSRRGKMDEQVPQKHEVYLMADSARSLRDRAIVLTLYSTGLRNSTLRALRYKDVKEELLQELTNIKIPVYPEMKEVLPPACKNGVTYFVFACREATEALRRYLQNRTDRWGEIGDEDPLFASKYNQVNSSRRNRKFLTARQLRNVVKSAAKRAGLQQWKDTSPKSLRKSFENVLRSKTADGNRLDTKVQEFFMGHVLGGARTTTSSPQGSRNSDLSTPG